MATLHPLLTRSLTSTYARAPSAPHREENHYLPDRTLKFT